MDERRRVAEALLDALPPETAEEIEARLESGEEQALDGAETLAALEAKYHPRPSIIASTRALQPAARLLA